MTHAELLRKLESYSKTTGTPWTDIAHQIKIHISTLNCFRRGTIKPESRTWAKISYFVTHQLKDF